MDNETLKQQLTGLLASVTFEEGGEWLNVLVEPADWKAFAQQLKQSDALKFDYLFCETCVDWKTHLTMVYHLSSTVHRHTIVVKCKLDRETPVIETVCDIWRTAEFHEREVFEMFGVEFKNHPDLRKLILPADWVGYPLRKDYDDPINMIKL